MIDGHKKSLLHLLIDGGGKSEFSKGGLEDCMASLIWNCVALAGMLGLLPGWTGNWNAMPVVTMYSAMGMTRPRWS